MIVGRPPARPADAREAGAVGVVAGNRNIALFLAAFPASQMEPLMVLVGCYQIPMFLTPIVMGRFYRRLVGRGLDQVGVAERFDRS